MNKLIKKVSGIKEPFDEQKIMRSLAQIGTNQEIMNKVLNEIKKEFPKLKSTKQIFSIVLEYLKERDTILASRYNLKKALLAFGPAGFPFEQFVANLFHAMGYKTETDKYMQGFCVQHEIDIIAIKKQEHHMVECKFHNKQQYKSDVKVPLYVQARFEDIKKLIEQKSKVEHKIHQPWVVTNTSFTTEAIAYAECMHMKLMSWKYPQGSSLRDLIPKYNLHPITTLVSLTGKEQDAFLKHGWVLCRDAQKHAQFLKTMGWSQERIDRLVEEAEATCNVN